MCMLLLLQGCLATAQISEADPAVTDAEPYLSHRIYLHAQLDIVERLRGEPLEDVDLLEVWFATNLIDDKRTYEALDYLDSIGFDGPLSWDPAPVSGFPVGEVAKFIKNEINLGPPDLTKREMISGLLWEAGIPYAWDHLSFFELLYPLAVDQKLRECLRADRWPTD